jgi:TRAP-type C4-dicarboxylate transport system permease small subunit
MNALHRSALAIAQAGARIGGALILLAAVVIAIDVVLRATFSRTVGGADELSGYALAIATAWGLSLALLHRLHIRIDSFYELLPPPFRIAIDLVSLMGFIVFIGLITIYAWGVLGQSLTSSTRSISALAVPVAIPQATWVAGFLFLILVLLLLLVESIGALLRGDVRGFFALIGPKAIAEEVEEEKADQTAAIAEIREARP